MFILYGLIFLIFYINIYKAVLGFPISDNDVNLAFVVIMAFCCESFKQLGV